jgi:mono/diheme cytochrome c family protein
MKRFAEIVVVAAAIAIPALAAGDAAAGKAVYDKSCKSCHGADGTPNASVAKMMKVEMLDLKSSEVQALSEDDMKKIVTGGRG